MISMIKSMMEDGCGNAQVEEDCDVAGTDAYCFRHALPDLLR